MKDIGWTMAGEVGEKTVLIPEGCRWVTFHRLVSSEAKFWINEDTMRDKKAKTQSIDVLGLNAKCEHFSNPDSLGHDLVSNNGMTWTDIWITYRIAPISSWNKTSDCALPQSRAIKSIPVMVSGQHQSPGGHGRDIIFLMICSLLGKNHCKEKCSKQGLSPAVTNFPTLH